MVRQLHNHITFCFIIPWGWFWNRIPVKHSEKKCVRKSYDLVCFRFRFFLLTYHMGQWNINPEGLWELKTCLLNTLLIPEIHLMSTYKLKCCCLHKTVILRGDNYGFFAFYNLSNVTTWGHCVTTNMCLVFHLENDLPQRWWPRLYGLFRLLTYLQLDNGISCTKSLFLVFNST